MAATHAETHLHFNIQNTGSSLLGHILHSLYTRSIEVAAKLSMLDEAVFVDFLLELVLGHIPVVLAMFLAGSWVACGVGNGKREAIGIGSAQTLDEGGFAGAGGTRNYDRSRFGVWFASQGSG